MDYNYIEDDDEFGNILESLRNNVCNIMFTKIDGTIRQIKGTLKKDLLPEKYQNYTDKDYEPTYNKDIIKVYDLDASSFKSIYKSKIMSFTLEETPLD